MIKAIKNHDSDNVVTVFGDAGEKDSVVVFDKKGNQTSLVLANGIPYGHKAAVLSIKAGEQIIKYGEQIGIATRDILVGEHVHIHNIDSTRGRGDWADKEEN